MVAPGLSKYVARFGLRMLPLDVKEFFSDIINRTIKAREANAEACTPLQFLANMPLIVATKMTMPMATTLKTTASMTDHNHTSGCSCSAAAAADGSVDTQLLCCTVVEKT